MKTHFLFILLLLCALGGLALPVQAVPADVTVTSTVVDPQVLMKGDTGTITISVQNTGKESVAIRSARLSDNNIQILHDPYPSVGEIGAGNTKLFTFPIRTYAADGTYFPGFVLDFLDGGSLRYPIPVTVESSELQVALLKKPDAFSPGRTADVTLRVGNPRSAGVTGVSVVPEGEGFSVTPSSAFIGALGADQSATVTFNITPEQASEIEFRVLYKNGVNTHTASLMLPVTFSTDKKQAYLVLTNIEAEPRAGGYRIVGDVINAGLENARSIVITAGEGAVPMDPYRMYVVGSLDPDDFSSFEVTFRVQEGVTAVPLVIEYRDENGNLYTSTAMVDITGAGSTVVEQGEYPTAALGLLILLVIGIAGIVAYSWRRARVNP